jgi:hypothetical protein
VGILIFILLSTTLNPPPIIYTPPEGEWDACEAPEEWNACEAPEEWNDFCISVTSYWPFDKDGNLMYGTIQTDEDPTGTATGWQIYSVEQSGDWVAAPLPFITNGYYSDVCFPSFYQTDCYPVYDTFGHPVYQAGGFWHSGYQEKVVPVDIFSKEIHHYLSCNDDDNRNRYRINIYKDGELTNP